MEQINILDESSDKKYFTIIPNYILNHSTLWDREVYIQMKRITGEGGTCWTSQNTLAKQCGISINRLKKSIKYLTDHNWIKFVGKKTIITKGGNQEVNEYKIIDLWQLNNDFYLKQRDEKKDIPSAKGVSLDDIPLIKGVSREYQRGVTDEAKGVSPDDDKEEHFNNITIKEEHIAANAAIKDFRKIFDLFYKSINPAINWANKTQQDAANWIINKFGEDKAIQMTQYAISIQGTDKFAPVITTPYQLKEKLSQLFIYKQNNNNQSGEKITDFDKLYDKPIN